MEGERSGYRAIFALPFSSTCTLSADPQLLCIFSWLLLALLVATPRNWLNASVVRFTRTFSEPIRRKPRSFSACSTNHRVTTLQSSSRAHSLRTFLFSLSLSLFLVNLSKGYFFFQKTSLFFFLFKLPLLHFFREFSCCMHLPLKISRDN